MPTLNWIGKEAVVNHHHKVPFHLLKDVPELSVGDPGSGNLIVQGDNLLALKALLPYYAGQVKCIYIDPPYNTGKQVWKYNDRVDHPVMKAWLEQTLAGHEIDEADLTRHEKWLCMMYPRLELLKKLLRKDGIIWASIDGTELHHLLCLFDEIFQESNRVGIVIWKNATDNNPTRITTEHEYIICYARDEKSLPQSWKQQNPLAKELILKKYGELKSKLGSTAAIQKELRRFIKIHTDELQPLTHYNRVDEGGPYTGGRKAHNPGKDGYHFNAYHDKTGKPCVEPARGYRFPESTYKQMLADGKILFGKDHNQIIQIKEYLEDYEGALKSVIDQDSRTAANALEKIFGNRTTFRNPKSVEVIQELLAYSTGDDDVVLDSFAGSGTTGQAVLELNAQDKKTRKVILIEMDTNICREVTARRAKGVVEGYGTTAALGGGFRYCELGEPIFDERGQIKPSVRFKELARHVYFTETGETVPNDKSLKSPLVHVYQDSVAIYLLFNGILGDKSVDGGNVLTRPVLAKLPKHDGPKVIYAAGCRLGKESLRAEQITFRQTPYEIKVS